MNRIVFLFPLLIGCAELEPFLPKVNFENFELRDINFQDVDADFIFNVDNPNPLEISLSSFSYELGFEQVELLAGDNQDGFTLEASDGSELRLPIHLNWNDAWNAVQATQGKDTIGFGLGGHFGFDTPIGEAKLPYHEDGEFPALRTPEFSYESMRVADFDPFGMTAAVEIDLGVRNEHASNFGFNSFDYDVSLGGDPVASGLVLDLGAVDGDSTGTLVLPINIDLFEVGHTVYQALAGSGSVSLGLDAHMGVDTPFGVLPLAIDETGNIQVEGD